MQGYLLIYLGACLTAAVSGGEMLTLEDVDVEKISKEDTWKTVYACLMDQAPCGEMQKLKDSAPRLVETKCGECTPRQKEKFNQLNKIISDKYPKQYEILLRKYSSKSD